MDVQLFLKVYRKEDKKIYLAIKRLILNHIGELDVHVDKIEISSDKRFINLTIHGSDCEVAKNYLEQIFGKPLSKNDLKKSMTLKSYLQNPEKVGYGIYVDIGLLSPKKDALLPLYELREKLVSGSKLSLRKITFIYGLVENFPFYVTLSSVSTDLNGVLKIYATIAEKQLLQIKTWISDGYERVIVTGALRQEIRKAILKTGHLRDIISIDRLGLLEHVVVCKKGTNAAGLISEIGPILKFAKLGAFVPKNIRKYIKK
ncbi:MAG: DUF2110 family protein [Candidatus Asgardarchaeia archaeon]